MREKLTFTKKKVGIIVLALVSLLAILSVVSACTTQTHTPQPQLHLSATAKYSKITLTARLSNSEPVSGVSVQFYSRTSKGIILKEIGSSITHKNGVATLVWSATKNGDYYFVASCMVTNKIVTKVVGGEKI